ncbi:TIGR02452 family protein [Streptomyces sp. NPDC029526]|uniref:TIGR02452 family protein n=1 Tax=Streptomyces sp. NPDC029526 TaxID=3155728 RepID=UPI0033C3C217
MSARLRGLARETESIVAAGRYRAPDGREHDLAAAVRAAREGTRMFGPQPVPVPDLRPTATRIEVTGESSLEAARRLVTTPAAPAGHPSGRTEGPSLADAAPVRPDGDPTSSDGDPTPSDGDVLRPDAGPVRPDGGPVRPDGGPDGTADAPAVLNFASARNPGGGYLNGAQAQEEALCRASALHTCLLRAPAFYEHHRTHRDPFYTDRVIHSPAVPVFRDDRGRLLDEPFTAHFLTSPAPNAGVILRRLPERAAEIPGAVTERAGRVLETAAAVGHRRLVLGAWGCGVFRNDPAVVAGAFRSLIGPGGRFAGTFGHVVFAVLDRTAGGATRAAFEQAFADLATRPEAVAGP